MLAPGVVLLDRFVLGPLLGAGAMGQVFEAEDRRTGATVAVKVLADDESSTNREARFAAEIGLLEELTHPGIVRYIAHGTAEDDRPFLVMERLVGEDLDARLRRGTLGIEDALLLVERVAAALAEAHQRGIVHRDIKPSNLFLRDGAVDRVTVLDFGIARRAGGGRALTRTGTILGTPEYMAPEQARGEGGIGPAADVFALGAVLYHCLAGRPPFTADHVLATLAKILFEEPVPLSSMRTDAPPAVGALLDRMLEKSPSARLPTGGAVRAAVADVRAQVGALGHARPQLDVGLGGGELELVTVLVVARPARLDTEATLEASTDARHVDDPGASALLRSFQTRGVPAQRLADGSIVATLGGGPAIDQALEAIGCARLARVRWPESRVAVATARRVAGTALPVGEALERAAALLAAAAAEGAATGVLLDSVTAGLVDGRIVTAAAGAGRSTLHDDSAEIDASRPLLGKATPCVGRYQELAMLELALAGSFGDGASRAVLVVAPPGLGKSRLRHELSGRLERRVEQARPILRLEARGEPLRACSPHGLIAQALRSGLALPGVGAPLGTTDVTAAVSRHLPGERLREVAEILGELLDVPFLDEDSVTLRAARQDPRLMQARIGDALVALLRGMTEQHDVLMILEDLHWADRTSLDLLGASLRELEDRPLLVLAFARPEIHELAPDLWKGRVVEVPLRPLPRRACERLVERVAGDRLSGAAIARIVSHCDGNALYLEELVRAACEGHGDAAPETVLAMLQARIAHLGPAERRALRAASVFGEAFELEGVRAVLGPAVEASAIVASLAQLAREELVEPQRGSASAFRIRHGLMRDAAYGLLVENDRRVGHRLAASFLADRAEDAAVVAEHLRRSDQPSEAAPWFLKAAQRAHDRDDYVASGRLASSGREAGAEGEVLGALRALEAWSAIMRWDWTGAASVVDDALSFARVGTVPWCYAVRAAAQLSAYRNDRATLLASIERFLREKPEEPARVVYADSALHLASAAIQVGLTPAGRALIARADATLGEEMPRHASVAAWRGLIRCTLHRHTDDDLGKQLDLLEQSLASYRSVGASKMAMVVAADILGEVECRAGLVPEGQARLRTSHADAQALGIGWLVAHARLALANALVAGVVSEQQEEAARLAEELLATRGITDGYQAMARDVLSATALFSGDHARAADEARRAIALSPHTPVRRWLMSAHLVEARIGLGDSTAARALAAESLEEIAAAGEGGGYAELTLLVAAAHAAEGAGAIDEARQQWARAVGWCERQSASFTNEDTRARYRQHVASILAHA